jgi:hypothetical protein
MRMHGNMTLKRSTITQQRIQWIGKRIKSQFFYFKRMMVRIMINEVKGDTYKHLNEIKENTNSYMSSKRT